MLLGDHNHNSKSKWALFHICCFDRSNIQEWARGCVGGYREMHLVLWHHKSNGFNTDFSCRLFSIYGAWGLWREWCVWDFSSAGLLHYIIFNEMPGKLNLLDMINVLMFPFSFSIRAYNAIITIFKRKVVPSNAIVHAEFLIILCILTQGKVDYSEVTKKTLRWWCVQVQVPNLSLCPWKQLQRGCLSVHVHLCLWAWQKIRKNTSEERQASPILGQQPL